MATGVTVIKHPYDDRVKIFKWSLASGETGETVFIPHLSGDKSFGCVGTFNSSSVSLLGTLEPDETTLVALKNAQGDALLFTADNLESVAAACYGYAPKALTITAVDCYLFAR